MNVNEFINKFKSVENKEKCVKGHIVTKYVPYVLKIDECKRIVESTNYKEIDGKKIFWQNTPGKFFLFTCRLISLYTDIDLEDGNNIIDSFDKLNEIGLISMIISLIPQSEYDEFKNILNMIEEDAYENTRSLVSYVDTKIDAMKLVFDSINKSLEDINIEE